MRRGHSRRPSVPYGVGWICTNGRCGGRGPQVPPRGAGRMRLLGYSIVLAALLASLQAQAANPTPVVNSLRACRAAEYGSATARTLEELDTVNIALGRIQMGFASPARGQQVRLRAKRESLIAKLPEALSEFPTNLIARPTMAQREPEGLEIVTATIPEILRAPKRFEGKLVRVSGVVQDALSRRPRGRADGVRSPFLISLSDAGKDIRALVHVGRVHMRPAPFSRGSYVHLLGRVETDASGALLIRQYVAPPAP